MRPAVLFPLFAETSTLPGVGPQLARLMGRIAGDRIVDLLFYLPTGVIDRTWRPKLNEIEEPRVATFVLNVLDLVPHRDPRQPFRVRCSDDTSAVELVFFHAKPEYLARLLPPGARRIVSGRIERFGSKLQMVHPDHIVPPEEPDRLPAHEPVYALTEKLSGKVLTKAIRNALDTLPVLSEWQDQSFMAARDWPSFAEAIRAVHTPEHENEIEPTSPARTRLAYDELLANQLALTLIRKRLRTRKGRAFAGDGRLIARARAALPFALTDAQQSVLEEVLADMAGPQRMVRLVQGDVGAGKTIVALLAMLNAIEAGAQAALMAPTELLARQHLAALAPIASAAGVRIDILTGRERGSQRERLLTALAAGKIDILVGTHALFSEDVEFRNLGLAVVDEQHRFGVHQRLKLQGKAEAPAELLVMTATPIPRTLALTAYGDMDVSHITGQPPGRKPVDTRLGSLDRIDEVIAHLRRAVSRGERAYWVCPIVEESEKLDLAAAEGRAALLRQYVEGNVGLVHGRMKPSERDTAMARFRSGETQILVATTVIEVGVDVPEATIMVVEHAERFGLSQLHQLRGRVGRGERPASCLLLYQPPISATARARLTTLRDTNDGFVIAEEDLRLRGPGEFLGTRQSGLPEFRLVDLAAHAGLLAAARDDARLIIERDPQLESVRGEALRVLLYLFGRDDAVRYLHAG
ncbi:MAG TPA: ATP-dependent DNA helicase RecG [Rhizomicrobium sp.]|jgi:ATP-dependent DNA helicase RecG|nr:ATP-dependent DNA helicase RecG [Rhizomicrobium sp.]